jgi:transcriptional regulator with XRE-family HTH domain
MNPETQHVISVLKNAIRAAKLRNRDVERTLGLSSSYLSRLFSGMIELRFEHILKIAEAVGLQPFEIIQAIYPFPRNPPTEAMMRLQEILRHLKPPPPPPGWTPAFQAAFERRLENALWQTLRRIRLSLALLPVPRPAVEAAEEPPVEAASAVSSAAPDAPPVDSR